MPSKGPPPVNAEILVNRRLAKDQRAHALSHQIRAERMLSGQR